MLRVLYCVLSGWHQQYVVVWQHCLSTWYNYQKLKNVQGHTHRVPWHSPILWADHSFLRQRKKGIEKVFTKDNNKKGISCLTIKKGDEIRELENNILQTFHSKFLHPFYNCKWTREPIFLGLTYHLFSIDWLINCNVKKGEFKLKIVDLIRSWMGCVMTANL